LSFKQSDIKISGHAIECRICIEDPMTFAPAPGKIRRWRPPQGPGTRVDTCAYSGYDVPIHYDPMVAKLICWGPNREAAIARTMRALKEFMITGVKSNNVLHRNILQHPKFIDGSYTTQFIDESVKGKSFKEFFTFVDDHVFLIAAAIGAYNQLKNKDVSKLSVTSRWKRIGRAESMRKS
jgi:acetyl-CoA carboxylase biotin carboxylase subunit